jgi:hypothetical protein
MNDKIKNYAIYKEQLDTVNPFNLSSYVLDSSFFIQGNEDFYTIRSVPEDKENLLSFNVGLDIVLFTLTMEDCIKLQNCISDMLKEKFLDAKNEIVSLKESINKIKTITNE